MNDSLVLPTTNYLSFVASPSIFQRSTQPSLAASLALEGVSGGGAESTGLGVGGGNITIETTPPKVDVVRGVEVSGAGNGTYAAGDELFITIWWA